MALISYSESPLIIQVSIPYGSIMHQVKLSHRVPEASLQETMSAVRQIELAV